MLERVHFSHVGFWWPSGLEQGFTTYYICVPPAYPQNFLRTPGYSFLNLHTPNIKICIPLCYILYTQDFFKYPLGLEYPSLRNPDLKHYSLFSSHLDLEVRGYKKKFKEDISPL